MPTSVKMCCDNAGRFQIQFHAFESNLLKENASSFQNTHALLESHPVPCRGHSSDSRASIAASAATHPSPRHHPSSPASPTLVLSFLGPIRLLHLDGHLVCSGQQRTQGPGGERRANAFSWSYLPSKEPQARLLRVEPTGPGAG